MTEYSTIDHYLQIHDNHSEQFAIKPSDDGAPPAYRHVEQLKMSASMVPLVLGNATDVHCSPRFSLRKLIEISGIRWEKSSAVLLLIVHARCKD